MSSRLFIALLVTLGVLSCRKDPKIKYGKHSFDFSGEWTYRYYQEVTGSVPYTVLDTLHLWFEGDTVMNRYTRYNKDSVSTVLEEHVYQRLRYRSHEYFNPSEGSSVAVYEGVKAYIREDELIKNRLYITYDTTDGLGWTELTGDEETLLFDFNLGINDSLEWCRWYKVAEGYNWNVASKETIVVGNYEIEKINLYQNGLHSSSILVGIGAMNRFDETRDGDLIHFHCDQFDYTP